MRGILVIAVLTIKSSYTGGEEIPLGGPEEVPDTVQWWFSDRGCWRIRTYAVDHDVHVLAVNDSPKATLEMAKQNNQKNYADIIKVQYQLRFSDCTTESEVQAEFRKVGLVPRLQFQDQFVFWKPDETDYWTQSSPKSE